MRSLHTFGIGKYSQDLSCRFPSGMSLGISVREAGSYPVFDREYNHL